MKYICILYAFILFGSTLFGQKRISNFDSEGSNKDFYLKSYEDSNYLLSVDQNNKLSVYRLIDENNKEFLHTQTFQGLYNQFGDIEFKNNYVVFASAEEIVDYDFVNDVIHSAPVPEGYYFSRFAGSINTSENRVAVSIKNLAQTDFKGIVYEIGGKIYETDRTPFLIYQDFVFEFKYDNDTRSRVNMFKNYITHTVDTVGTAVPFGQYPAQVDNSVYYFNKEGELYSFDLDNRETSPVSDIKLDEFGWTNSIHVHNNDLVLISSWEDSCIIQYYDKTLLERKNTFRFNPQDYIFGSVVKTTDGAIAALLEDHQEIFILDLNTGEHFIHPTNYFWGSHFEILENRYIVNPYPLSYNWNGPHKFELIDLQDMTIDSIGGTFKMERTYNVGFAKFGATYLTAYKYRNREKPTLFNVDIEAKEAQVNSRLDSTVNGLSGESSLFKLNNEIYLIGPNLYQVNGTELDSIYPIDRIQEVNHQPIHTQENKVVFVQDDPKAVYSYDGTALVEEADLSELESISFTNVVDNFVIKEELVLFTDLLGDLYRYEKASKKIAKLSNHPTSLSSTVLTIHNGHVYFSEGSKLYTTDGYNYQLVLENYDPDFLLGYNNLIDFQDHLFTYTEGAFIRIDQNNNTEEVASGFRPFFNAFAFDKPGQNLLMGDNDKKVHYDGSEYYEFPLEHGGDFGAVGSYNSVFFFQENGSEGLVNTFFNGNTKVYDKLPDEVQQYHPIDYFESNGEYFLLMRSGFNPYDKLYVYKTDENISKVDLLHEYLDVGSVQNTSFSKYYDEGFLYTGDLLFLMDTENEFSSFPNIKGDSKAYVEEKDGETYFLALDPIYGRQLFTSTLKSFRVNNEEVISESQNLSVYPNPASESLQFDGGTNSSFQESVSTYHIYNLQGKVVNEGHTSGLISISNLAPGSYILIVENKSETRKTLFIKQ